MYAISKICDFLHFGAVNNKRDSAYLKAFGQHLRKLRKAKGLTMMELAFECDVEYSQIAKIERGVVNTTISTIFALSKALQVEPFELVKFTFDNK